MLTFSSGLEGELDAKAKAQEARCKCAVSGADNDLRAIVQRKSDRSYRDLVFQTHDTFDTECENIAAKSCHDTRTVVEVETVSNHGNIELVSNVAGNATVPSISNGALDCGAAEVTFDGETTEVAATAETDCPVIILSKHSYRCDQQSCSQKEFFHRLVI